jgi:hypothetical protein
MFFAMAVLKRLGITADWANYGDLHNKLNEYKQPITIPYVIGLFLYVMKISN